MHHCITSKVHDATPTRVLWKKPDLSHIRIFGLIVYVHILNEKRQKLEKCILLGYSLEQNGCKCFNPSTRKVQVSRDVIFDESTSWYIVDPVPSDPIETNFDIGLE